MSLDLLMLGNVPIPQMVERARLAEASGYDTLWVADERFYREVYSTLAVLAQHTSRVRLGTCVTDPFARHPALTAMAIATLDEISNKRAILGVGAGISGFAELGVVRKKPAIAIREMIEVVRALLKGEPVDFHSIHARLEPALQEKLTAVVLGTEQAPPSIEDGLACVDKLLREDREARRRDLRTRIKNAEREGRLGEVLELTQQLARVV